MDMVPYASLLNQRIVIPASKGHYVAVERHFFTSCMEPLLETIHFDEEWYLQTYPDVRDAIATKIVPNAKVHYTRFGYSEHRMPYRILVDEAWYISEYPDIREAIAKQHFFSGQAHFDQDGFREGRFPYPNFKLELSA
jgi:hypothetical protein